MVKKPLTATSTRTLSTGVALPASTGEGVVHDISTVDALGLGEHQNNDIAGDLAAAAVTRPVLAVGSVVEPVNPALASEPAITGDAAGDAAIAAAGAGPEFVQPVAVSMESLRPDTFGQSAFLHVDATDLSNTPERSATAVEVGAGNSASPAVEVETSAFSIASALAETGCSDYADLVDMALVGTSLISTIDSVTRDGILKGWSPADDPAEIVFDLINMIEERRSLVGVTEPAHRTLDAGLVAGATHLRVSAKIAGFRRAGIAHPAEAVEYRLDRFTSHEVEAILTEPNLVAEII
ncbi:hypothetical protein [Rhizobium sp. NFR12]|uniref:hypothetical protein n=1 Tax=Rhizobium sp. NFR12 TaxID=1566261 RepID=UPI0008A7EBF4|nr:hypothetical protein [Rhizobium sp. NFR12]SEH22536.1 hypothetical protein SAMN03159407_1177 [Rhizobium sp. NFR12]